MSIIGHIVCLDDKTKKKLIDDFSYINIIDLDKIANDSYNNEEVQQYKNQMIKLSEGIAALQKKIKLLQVDNKIKVSIDKLIDIVSKKKNRRCILRSYLKSTWKSTCNEMIDDLIKKSKLSYHLFIGYNVYPYDHRIKIDLGLKMRQDRIPTHIIYDIDTDVYAQCQIQFYLDTYREKIIRGQFNLNLLKKEHVTKRFEKLLEYYDGINYKFISPESINSHIYMLYKIAKDSVSVQDRVIYFATYHRIKNNIPINPKHPLEGFVDRSEAINRARELNTKKLPIYLYKTTGNNFNLVGGKLLAYANCDVELSESILFMD